MDLRQLTVYEHFRWVNMRAITFLFVDQSSSASGVRIPPLAPKWGTNALNIRPNFKYSRFGEGGGREDIPIWVCAIKTLSISSAYENLRGQHPLRGEM